MKIALVINSFKQESDFNHREKLCVESFRRLKNKFKEVQLINFTFNDENIKLDGFENFNTLKNNPSSLVHKKIPYINEIFDNAASLDTDYFVFVNNDIIVSDRYIKEIINHPEIDIFPASKLHFMKLDSLDDRNSEPESLSVHGFDGFAVRNKWWKKNSYRFKDMLLSRAYWDTYFFTKCMLYGNCKVLNKPPTVIFHIDHKSTSMEDDIGNTLNEKTFINDPDNLAPKWFGYVQNVLLKRPTVNKILWYEPFANEEDLEKIYFKI